jgi:hypothetical protein
MHAMAVIIRVEGTPSEEGAGDEKAKADDVVLEYSPVAVRLAGGCRGAGG